MGISGANLPWGFYSPRGAVFAAVPEGKLEVGAEMGSVSPGFKWCFCSWRCTKV